jgi:hypothetical protein
LAAWPNRRIPATASSQLLVGGRYDALLVLVVEVCRRREAKPFGSAVP